jgi:thiol-disulfide isomerase/thioredoxin
MFERFFILLAVAALVALGWGVLRLWRGYILRRMQATSPFRAVVPPGRPAVVAFSTPSCAECRTRQAPALRRLEAKFGDAIVVRALSALEHPELADQAGILTVPATVVLDSSGTVRHLNLGFTDAERLALQLQSAM